MKRLGKFSLLAILFTTLILFAQIALATSERSLLWDIVSNCLDSNIADYCMHCRVPQVDSKCACLSTTEVWKKSDDFVVIRDHKMCGCPDGFVHGLALPLKQVTGVEDKNRPTGIWSFAWDVAKTRAKESDIALVVNEKACRSQDQLHVHIVKLNSDGHKSFRGKNSATVENLDQVWNKADELAQNAHLEHYGVLVKRDEVGFVVLVEDNCLEKIYTEYACDR